MKKSSIKTADLLDTVTSNFYQEEDTYKALQNKLDLIYQFKQEKNGISSLVSNHWVVRLNITKEHLSLKSIENNNKDLIYYVIEITDAQIADPSITFTIQTKKFETRKEYNGSGKTSFESGLNNN